MATSESGRQGGGGAYVGGAQVEGVDTRRVIAKLHALAIDPVNRPFIARDAGCIHNIVKTFSYPAGEDFRESGVGKLVCVCVCLFVCLFVLLVLLVGLRGPGCLPGISVTHGGAMGRGMFLVFSVA